MRVKVFGSISWVVLEDDINSFLEENDVEVVDIKYQYDDDWYTAMVIYKILGISFKRCFKERGMIYVHNI